jgi:hypothetical protein
MTFNIHNKPITPKKDPKVIFKKSCRLGSEPTKKTTRMPARILVIKALKEIKKKVFVCCMFFFHSTLLKENNKTDIII